MSVLIKGMEMPKSCSVCPMLEGDRMDGLCHAASKWLDDDEHWTWYVYPEGDMDDSKPCNCPLVPVPPHGRLIDADALYRTIDATSERTIGHTTFKETVLLDIRGMPTILESTIGQVNSDPAVNEAKVRF